MTNNYTILKTGFLRLLLSLLIVTGLGLTIVSAQTVNVNPTSPFTLPAGVTSITISVWGAGGGTGGCVGASADNASGGGGGGAFSSKTFTGLTPGSVYTIVRGAGGTAGST